MTRPSNRNNELAARHAATAAQLELLTRALREAKALPDQDVFVQAHVAALRRDRDKLKAELGSIRRERYSQTRIALSDRMLNVGFGYSKHTSKAKMTYGFLKSTGTSLADRPSLREMMQSKALSKARRIAKSEVAPDAAPKGGPALKNRVRQFYAG